MTPHDSVVFRHYRKCKIFLPSTSTKAEFTMLRLATVRGKRCSAPDSADPKIGVISLPVIGSRDAAQYSCLICSQSISLFFFPSLLP